jgi:AmmeMemoRadiSam system protein A
MHSPDRQDLLGTALLRLARSSIEHGLVHNEPLPIHVEELSAQLAEPAATFTTLHRDGRLRGCCGTLEAAHPLAVNVANSAFQAAFRDSRFDPVGQDEFDALRLEVSVLSPLEPVRVCDEADLLDRLQPGTDGLVLIEGKRRATFLPEVWEQLPEPRTFLAQLKKKSGLPEDYWSAGLEFRRYHTTLYAESAP